jgi:hypothetical protein
MGYQKDLFHGPTANPSFSLCLESSPQDSYDRVNDVLQRIGFQLSDFCHHKLTVSGEQLRRTGVTYHPQ